MATGISHQSIIPTCKDHLNEKLLFYCQTCNLRVCEDCLKRRHMTHTWMTNEKFARWIRQNRETRCEELEDMIRGLDIEDIEMKADIDKIEAVRRKWISAINDTADMMVEKRKTGKSRTISTAELTKIKKMLKFFKVDIAEADDKVAVEMEEEFHTHKQNISSRNKTQKKKLVFKEGKLSTDVIQQMFGDVVEYITQSKVKVTEKSNFTHIDDSNHISCIVPLQNNEALIKRFNDEYINHVDIKGKVIKRLQFNIGYFVQLNDDIVSIDFGKKKIQHITPSGTVSDVYSTSPLHPSGICKSYDGGLLVTLCSCNVSEITSESYGEVHPIDTSGGIINKYSHTEDGKSRLFICPIRVAQNMNTDLCVVECIDREGRSRLVVLSVSSQIKFTYTGQPDLKKKFLCNDIACDHHGRILLADALNHAVHLLSEDGEFLQYVLTEKSPLWGPQSMGLYNDTLWVGCSNGVVRVLKYTDEE